MELKIGQKVRFRGCTLGLSCEICNGTCNTYTKRYIKNGFVEGNIVRIYDASCYIRVSNDYAVTVSKKALSSYTWFDEHKQRLLDYAT